MAIIWLFTRRIGKKIRAGFCENCAYIWLIRGELPVQCGNQEKRCRNWNTPKVKGAKK